MNELGTQITWSAVWKNAAFKRQWYMSVLLLCLTGVMMPYFFAVIEKRSGFLPNDVLLNFIPPQDLSPGIFFTLYGSLIWMAWRLFSVPLMALLTVRAYFLLCVMRVITLIAVPLDPPIGLVPLSDPLSVFFYHGQSITKDLFFSGHTSIVCLWALCLTNKRERMIGFGIAVLIGSMLLIQHVHYTLDVIAAPFFSWISWYVGNLSLKKVFWELI